MKKLFFISLLSLSSISANTESPRLLQMSYSEYYVSYVELYGSSEYVLSQEKYEQQQKELREQEAALLKVKENEAMQRAKNVLEEKKREEEARKKQVTVKSTVVNQTATGAATAPKLSARPLNATGRQSNQNSSQQQVDGRNSQTNKEAQDLVRRTKRDEALGKAADLGWDFGY